MTKRVPAFEQPPLRLLIADDHEDAVELLAMLLREDGHNVDVAHNGRTALELAQRLRPDVVLLDINMPGMDGHAVARHLRASLPHARMLMVAVTGRGSADDIAEAHAAGFDQHFTKPVDTHILRTCIANWSRAMA